MEYVSGSKLATMKILHDYRNYGKTVFMWKDLHKFGDKVVKYANENGKGNFTLWHIYITAHPLNLICDFELYPGEFSSDTGVKGEVTSIDLSKYYRNLESAKLSYIMGLPTEILKVANAILNNEKVEYQKQQNSKNLKKRK